MTPRTLRATPLATAMHEAGHAVVRLALGGPEVQFVSVVDRSPGELGYCRMDTRFQSFFVHAKLPDGPEQAAMVREGAVRPNAPRVKLAWLEALSCLAATNLHRPSAVSIRHLR